MANNLKVEVPTLSKGVLISKMNATLSSVENANAEITVDFSELLPWANAAKEEVVDFFLLSAFVYGIDRFIPRRPNSTDGWAREINVLLPVFKVEIWKSAVDQVEGLLSFLTGDYWNVKFYKNSLKLPPADLDEIYKQSFKQINLFSGGLDSLIGSIDSLENSKDPVLFVSHYDRTMAGPKKDQDTLGPELETKYGKLFVHLPSVKVFLSQTSLSNRETTCRSRSLLFLGLSALTAEPLRTNIFVPENGTVSVNYPLSPSRRSACSTRTTHPTFFSGLMDIWKILGINIAVQNPYWNKTKGEMVANCKNKTFLQQIIPSSNSCGKRGHRSHWDDGHASHCGICMPCIYRQASLQTIADNTSYGNNINKLIWTTKKGQDVGALLDFLKENVSKNNFKFELIANGLQDYERINEYMKLIERTRIELISWIKKEGNSNVRSKGGL